MNNREHTEFTFWKRPWHKWVFFTGALLGFLSLWMNIQEYNDISRAGILGASEWAAYASGKNRQCALNGMQIIYFSGVFLIGAFARSQKAVRLMECLLLLFLALAWSVAGAALHLISPDGNGLFWVFILLLALGGAVYSFLRYRRGVDDFKK